MTNNTSAGAGRTVLITGANRGIGLAYAQLFKAKGWKVLATTRNPDKASELKATAEKVFDLDVGSEQSINELSKKVGDEKIDLLINNAGVYLRTAFEDMKHQDLVHEFLVNAVGPTFTTRALMPNLLKSDKPRVINMTSRMGSIGDNTSGRSYGYRASKSALNAMTKTFSIEHPEVPVLLIHPGYIQTDMTSGKGDMDSKQCVEKLFEIIDQFVNVPQAECKFKSGQFIHRDQYELPW